MMTHMMIEVVQAIIFKYWESMYRNAARRETIIPIAKWKVSKIGSCADANTGASPKYIAAHEARTTQIVAVFAFMLRNFSSV